MTGGLNYVARVESALFGGTVCLFTLKVDGPPPLAAIPACGLKIGLGPYVQFEQLGVGFEPLRKLVLGRKDRPVRREREVRQMIIPNRIVEHQLMVSVWVSARMLKSYCKELTCFANYLQHENCGQ